MKGIILTVQDCSNPRSARQLGMRLLMTMKRRKGRSTLGRREAAKIAGGKATVNPDQLMRSLQALLDSDQHPGNETVALLANLRLLDCVPREAEPLFKKVLDKYPHKKAPSKRIQGLK